jgi:hypothetical protein
LKQNIAASFDAFDACKKESATAALTHFGSGWAWLVLDESHCDRIAIMHLGKVDALGTCEELEASMAGGVHALNDVFVHYAGSALESGGSFRDVSAERATAQRLD